MLMIVKIADEDLTYFGEVMAVAETLDEAQSLVDYYGPREYYGVAIVDTDTGEADVGFGFGVSPPEQ